MNDKALFKKIAAIFNLPYTEYESGDIELEIKDTIWYYDEQNKILEKRIQNKMALVITYRIDVAPMKGTERLLMLEEIYRLEQELLDLEIKYISNNDYVKNFQGHIEQGRISYQQAAIEAKQNLPSLIEEVKEFVNNRENIFEATINAQLIGLVYRGNEALRLQNEKEISDSYKDLRILFYHAKKDSTSGTQ